MLSKFERPLSNFNASYLWNIPGELFMIFPYKL